MKKRGWEYRRVLAVVITVAIVALLVLSGPAKAITVGITRTDGSDDPYEGTKVYFTGKVDIHTTDQVNLKAITVLIDDTPSDALTNAVRCNFYLNGTAFSNNSDICQIEITSITQNYTNAGYGYGNAYGYGYKFSTGETNLSNFSFNKGYRYSYRSGYGFDAFNQSLGSNAEIVVKFTWTTPFVDVNTPYAIGLGVIAGESSDDQVLFLSEDSVELTVLNFIGSGGTETTTRSNVTGGTVTTQQTIIHPEVEGIEEIKLFTTKPIQDASVEVKEVTKLTPEEVGFAIGTPVEQGKARLVYKYLKITTSEEVAESITSAKIKFKVSKEWLEENDLEKYDILLMRFSEGEWNELPTTVVSEDLSYVYYESTTPSFSYFAVAVRKEAAVKPQQPLPEKKVCAQVITYAIDPKTGKCFEFSTPCDVPSGWSIVDKCPSKPTPPQEQPPSKIQQPPTGLTQNEKLAIFLGAIVIILLAIWLFVYRGRGGYEGEILLRKRFSHHKVPHHRRIHRRTHTPILRWTY